MLRLDDIQLYDLPRAGALLHKDPVRLEREARRGRIPFAWVAGGPGLPAPWVEAEAGLGEADAEALATYWCARLAPPGRDARRPLRPLSALPTTGLLVPEEAARRLFATPHALERLDREGWAPSLRVEGAVVYDETLIERLAEEDENDASRQAAQERRDLVRGWARYEYGAVPAVAASAALLDARPRVPGPQAPPDPGCYEIPADLSLGDITPLAPLAPPTPRPPSRLLEVEGFEAVDED